MVIVVVVVDDDAAVIVCLKIVFVIQRKIQLRDTVTVKVTVALATVTFFTVRLFDRTK